MNKHSCIKIQFLSVHTFFLNVLIPDYRNPSVYSGFLSPSKDMHFKLIGDS